MKPRFDKTYRLILKRRTIRKFAQRKIKRADLLACVNAARLAPSAANFQPLEYVIVTKGLDRIFACTKWAGYLKDGAPKEGEKPTAYIIILSNDKLAQYAKYDLGFAAENIVLTALEKGIASCIIASLDREQFTKILHIPKNYAIELAVALGYPKQRSKAEEFRGDVKYWLDKKGILHVPKRSLKDIVHEDIF